MAKSFMKKAKKAVKSAKKEAKKEVKEVSSTARLHVESLSKQRRDCAIVWGMIKDGNHSKTEIREICKDKGFDQLLGEL